MPELHVEFVPQVPPSGLGVVASQTGAGAHAITPSWHGVEGAHAAPSEQEPQIPETQTDVEPHAVASGAGPSSMQLAFPSRHCTVPLWHP